MNNKRKPVKFTLIEEDNWNDIQQGEEYFSKAISRIVIVMVILVAIASLYITFIK